MKTWYCQGETHPNSKLTFSQVIEIFLSKDKPLYLAALYKVSPSAIAKIKSGRTWSHLTKGLKGKQHAI